MAERVLPSREESAKRAGQLRAEGLSFTAEYLALDAIASGRLVDREAINYRKFNSSVVSYFLWGDPPESSINSDKDNETAWDEAFDAALGEAHREAG